MAQPDTLRASAAHQAILQRAQRLAEKGDPAGARDQLIRAIRAAPDIADYHGFLSQAEFALGHLDAAEAAARQALALRPTDPELHGWLARVLRRNGHKVAAMACYRAALRLQPGHWSAAELPDIRAEIAASVQH